MHRSRYEFEVDSSSLKEKARRLTPPQEREKYRPFAHLAREEVEASWQAQDCS